MWGSWYLTRLAKWPRNSYFPDEAADTVHPLQILLGKGAVCPITSPIGLCTVASRLAVIMANRTMTRMGPAMTQSVLMAYPRSLATAFRVSSVLIPVRPLRR